MKPHSKKILPALFSCLLMLFTGCSEPVMISATDTFEDVKIQPREALEITEPYLETHATYHWRPEKPLMPHIVRHRKWYYIMRTNFPAKSTRYYLQPAVRVNTQDGSVSFTEK